MQLKLEVPESAAHEIAVMVDQMPSAINCGLLSRAEAVRLIAEQYIQAIEIEEVKQHG